MKAVIIGGGIGGLTLGLFLQNKNWTVVINEKTSGVFCQGHAFLISDGGYSILDNNFDSTNLHLISNPVKKFILKRPNDLEVLNEKLTGWRCVKRIDLITFLHKQLFEKSVINGRVFSHFLLKKDKAIAAVFENGEIEYGDIFIGADGSNSIVREVINGKVDYTPIEVKEIVGISKFKTISKKDLDVFQKIQSKEVGLAFGFIPLSLNEVVWYIQYDVNLANELEIIGQEKIKMFCYNITKHFPSIVKEILDTNDFSNTYIWNTRDFDLLKSFHKNNIVIMGDAAHLTLPFTSAGTTNAIIDAKILTDSLEKNNNYQLAFEHYYQIRSEKIKEQIEIGRELKKNFLKPYKHDEPDFILPLITDKQKSIIPKNIKQVKVSYFTDPICSTCWITQPIIRKLKLEYGNYIDFDYHMGGLLPSWEKYNNRIIKNPYDAAKHWDEMSEKHKIPLDGNIWIEDPLYSSFPPSIAFKAAQMQDNDKALYFLSRLKEMVFIKKMNITKWEYIEQAALMSGLDSAKILKDMNGDAKKLFKNDLRIAQSYNINVFPTLIFSNEISPKIRIQGLNPYEKYEQLILQLAPNIKKNNKTINPENLFTLFNSMTEQEFAFLYNTTFENGRKILDELFLNDKIYKYTSKNGIIWFNNQKIKK